MIYCTISEVFPRLYGFWDEAFVCLNYHELGVLLVMANGSALVREEIVEDGIET